MNRAIKFLGASTAVWLALASNGALADPAGRVLVAVGDTSIGRNGQNIPAQAGTLVESGDVLRAGEGSNLQVRFTDEAIVALRPNTVFKVDDYKFAGADTEGRSFFHLIKGGMRAITGLIGHRNYKNFGVKAETVTIGIRGTNFNLVNCNNDCFGSDGKPAPNGTYGGVTEGRIVAFNEGGELEFGQNEFFHAGSGGEPPRPLLIPPAFLRDRLEGLARAGRNRQAAPTPLPQSGGDGGAIAGGDSRLNDTAGLTAVTSVTPVNTQPQAAIEYGAGNMALAIAMAYTSPSVSTDATAIDGYVTEPDIAATVASLKPYVTGSSVDAGNVTWGVIPGGGGFTGLHWAIADAPVNLPTSGVATYSWIGGTTPTNQNGVAGTVTSGGVLQVDFAARTASMAAPLQYSVASSNYTLSFSGKPFGNFGPGTVVDITSSSSCSGMCTGLIYAGVNGRLTGTNAQGAIAAFVTQASVSVMTETTASVQVYKK